VIDLSIRSIPGHVEIIESDPLMSHIRDDVVIVYDCPVGINLRAMYYVNGTIHQRSSVSVSDVYADCPIRVQHDSEKAYTIQPERPAKPF